MRLYLSNSNNLQNANNYLESIFSGNYMTKVMKNCGYLMLMPMICFDMKKSLDWLIFQENYRIS